MGLVSLLLLVLLVQEGLRMRKGSRQEGHRVMLTHFDAFFVV